MRIHIVLLAVAFVAFISLGLPDGVLGVAWPSVRSTFRLPLSQLGSLLTASMLGYLISSFSSGYVVARAGVGNLLLYSSVLILTSLAGYALAPAWGVMVACGVLAGLGAGAIDAGLNAYAAAHFSPRFVNWLHACYGLGAALGPLLMTGVLTAGYAWRRGYAVLASIIALMAIWFYATRHLWEGAARAGPQAKAGVDVEGGPTATSGLSHLTDAPATHAGTLQTLRRPVVLGSVALFFVYTGLEVTAGQWAYSLFTEERGVRPAVAGVWVGAYWASLTAGRILFGAAAGRVPPGALLRLGLGSAPVAAALIWWAPAVEIGFVGLALLGFVLAPIFPLLIAQTPARVGDTSAARVIGYQISAACLGGAALPAGAGLLARRNGLEVVGPYLFAAAAALLVLHRIVLTASTGGEAPEAQDERLADA